MRFTQTQIEKDISDVIPHGVREAIAAGTGIYPKIVDAYFNPNDERKSPHFTVLHVQHVLDTKHILVGERVWQVMNSLRQASKPKQGSANLSPDNEMGKLSKEISDVIVAKCEGKPISYQLQQIEEARNQLNFYENALIASQDNS